MTTNAQHTPGPWGAVSMVNGAKGAYYIVGNRNGNNAEVELAQVGPTLSPHAEANARLIAAAPDGLEIAQEFLAFARSGAAFNYPPGSLQKLEQFLLKATGEPK